MLRIGLTGNIASGKSTVAEVWRKMGAKVIDVDELAHSLYKPRTAIWRKVIKAFGPDIVNKDKTINRAALAALVFCERKMLKKLERIMYPAMVKELGKQIKTCKNRVVVADMAVLFEARAQKLFDTIVLVKVSRPNQLKRLCKYRKLTKSQAKSRINSFRGQSDKAKRADHVLNGDKPLARLKKSAGELFLKIT
jgi:dephospho-CoA kinase